MVSALGLLGTSIERANALDNIPSVVSTKGSMDTIYPWWMDEREFPRRAVMTEWFYNPLKGQPRYIDIYRLRGLAASEWISMCTSTIIEEVCQVPWAIVPKDPKLEESPPEDILTEIDEVQYFLNNPNDNKNESITTIFRAYMRDSLELDAGSIVKGFSANSYLSHPSGGFELGRQGERQLVELFARDGGSFLSETDVNGIQYRWWQYSYLHPAVAPIEFDVNEIVYSKRYPRSYSVYGWSELQSAETILNLLINSTFTNATMFQEYSVPSGIVSFTGSQEDEDRLREYFRQEIKGRFHKVAVLNKEAKFVPLAYTNRDLEFLDGQRWFSRMIWALFKLTPTELGFQDEIRETGKAMANQTKLQKRKAVTPFLRLIEEMMNNQIINEFSSRIKFQFQYTDKEEEYADSELDMEKLDRGLITINELRKKKKYGGSVEWGDVPLPITLAELKQKLAMPEQSETGRIAQNRATEEPRQAVREAKTWGGKFPDSADFYGKDDRAAPIWTYNSKGEIIQLPDTNRVGPYAGSGKPQAYPMGAMGQRPDEPIRDGMMLPGENPEEVQRRRQTVGHEDVSEYKEELSHPRLPRMSGVGAHRWERDNTNVQDAQEAVNQDTHPVDQLAPARQPTMPELQNQIVPTPQVTPEGEHPKGKRDTPNVPLATGPKKKKPQKILGATGATGPQRESMGFLDNPDNLTISARVKQLEEKSISRHDHSDIFYGAVTSERTLHSKLAKLAKRFKNGELKKEEALFLGMKAIDENQVKIAEIARNKANKTFGVNIDKLSPEVEARLKTIRKQTYEDFSRVMDDVEYLQENP